ncbi:MAG: SDR family oxidoreductase [Anaerolineae bacterium]|nr:SDR family oxidoreductase [Phycisphaerae bacterium]
MPAQKDSSRRTVLITGANRGIGLGFAREYHAAGWNVIATARDPDAAKDLKKIGDDVRIVKLDVTTADSVEAMARTLKDQPIDLLINNAAIGISGASASSVSTLKADEFARLLEVNAVGPVRVTQALLPNLRAGKGKMIVGLSSGLGSITGNEGGGYYGYRESKAAIGMFMRSLAAELKDDGFTCIAIDPGWVKTDMGGPGAQLTVDQSVGGMRKVLDALKPADTGKFYRYDGSTLPW